MTLDVYTTGHLNALTGRPNLLLPRIFVGDAFREARLVYASTIQPGLAEGEGFEPP